MHLLPSLGKMREQKGLLVFESGLFRLKSVLSFSLGRLVQLPLVNYYYSRQ